MEKTINKRIEQYQIDVKTQIKNWFDTHNATVTTKTATTDGIDLKSEFLQFVFDNPSLIFEKDDFQKRKRITNNVHVVKKLRMVIFVVHILKAPHMEQLIIN